MVCSLFGFSETLFGSIMRSCARGSILGDGYQNDAGVELLRGYEKINRERDGRSMDDLVSRPSLPTINDPAYIQLVRIALCYYIAKADQVKPEEQQLIDEMCEVLLSDPKGSQDYRCELRMILADKGTNFSNLRRYLNRIEPKELEAFWTDVMRIAEANGYISDDERKALLVYESYVKERTRLQEDLASAGPGNGKRISSKVHIISLSCKNCDAILDVNSDLSVAFCPYCGTKHIICEQENGGAQ